MLALRTLLKKSYAPIVVGSLFFVLSNYCGFQAFEAAPHGGEHHEHNAPEASSHGVGHNDSSDHAHEDHHAETTSSLHENPSEQNGDKALCCPSTFCCSTINVDAALRDQLYYFFLKASAHTALTPVTAFTLTDPFKVEKVEWLHDIGPPQIAFKEPFYINAYQSHAPPIS